MSSRFSATNQSISLTSRLTGISTLRDECNRARHPRQSWGRGSAYERRYPECPPPFLGRPGPRMHRPDGVHGVRADRPELNDLHIETVRDFVIVGRCLGCGVTVLPLHYQALWRGARASQRSESVSVVSLLEFRRSPPLQAVGSTPCWMHFTTYSFIHHVDVVPRCSINNTVKTVLAVK